MKLLSRLIFGAFFTALTAISALGQGTITTLMGTGVCGYGPTAVCSPKGVTVGGDHIYFADSGNFRIRRFGPAESFMTTVAGTGVRGTSGTGGFNAFATIGDVSHLIASGSGVFFSDRDARKIRGFSLSSGIMFEYGTGNPISAGDGGPFESASFIVPAGIAGFTHASSGTGGGSSSPSAELAIVIADTAANAVRGVSVFNVMSTIAGPGTPGVIGDGGPGAGASIQAPEGLAVYNNELVYIADSGNHRIRRWNKNTGIITTVAGNGFAGFGGDGGAAAAASINSPGHITFDPAGNMYFTDRGNYRIRRVDTAGVITTVAGNGTSGFGQDNVPPTQTQFVSVDGVAWSTFLDGLVIADGSHRIRLALGTPTSTALTANPNPVVAGSTVTLAAAVTPGSATGTIEFLNGTVSIGLVPVTNGQATLAWTAPLPATLSLTSKYSGDGTFRQSTSSAQAVTVQLKPTTATIASSQNPSVFNASVTLSATVSPATATGPVQFWSQSQGLLGSAVLSTGVASISLANLNQGSNQVYARYYANGEFGESISPTLSQLVKRPVETTLSASVNPSTFGATVNLTAVVSASDSFFPAGAVEFFDGSTLLGTAGYAAGGAQFSVSALSAGAHNLTSRYGGDDFHFPATSSVYVLTVQKLATTTTLVSNLNPSNQNQPVTFSASVAPAAATGTVTFFDGAAALGTVSLTAGSGALQISTLTAGAHTITAQFNGGPNHNPSVSGGLSQIVKELTTTTLTATPASSTFGQSVTLRAALNPASATGTVQFFDGATLLGSANLSGGVATLATAALFGGTHSLTALYTGDAASASSASAAVSFSVLKANSTTSLTANPTSSRNGQTVTFTATVAPGTVTGSVQFTDAGVVFATVPLSGGTAVLQIATLSTANHSIRAVYSGSNNFNGSQSAILSFRVKP